MQRPPDRRPGNDASSEAPPALVAALKALPQPRPFIPPTVDEAVLAAARWRARKGGNPRFSWFRAWRWLAAASAVILLIAIIPQIASRLRSGSRPEPRFAREDVNHDGRVDILDALALAKQLKAAEASPAPSGTDGQPGGGGLDPATLAARVVRLDNGGRS